MEQQIEKQLLKRLKFLGFILIVFAVIALAHFFIPLAKTEFDLFEKEITQELDDPPTIHPLFVSAVFGTVGTGCLVISWKKKKSLFPSSLENKDTES